MKLDPIVISLLDTDLYKFNMDQVIFHKHTDLCGKYYFKCRNEGVKFTPEMLDEINSQIDYLCTLRFRKDELDYLRSIRFIKNDYVEFLRLWRPIREYVTTSLSKDGELSIIVDGPLFSAMQFEIHLLEIVNEVYFRMSYDYDMLLKSAEEKLNAKIEALNNGTYTFKFAEFGCRRRLSREWEDVVVRRLSTETDKCIGTSNVYLAMKYNLTPIGTYAHEFVQMYQGIDRYPLAYTNHYAMRDWYDEYDGDNGTALTDTITTDLFLLDFNRSNVNNYNGVRHDSGDPYEWGEKIIKHYESYGVDPRTKQLLFSDGLDFDRAQKLFDYFKDRAKVAFGIGTFCSNDTCVDALNIVIKLQYVNDKPVAKLSDNPEKSMCHDADYLKYLKRSVAFRLKRETI
ncbi:MAG: nicotinate phosphoribosyltransferase [Ruminococcus sp.]|nr:nicotinate phosphoribosyltransferase [Ruminococcus sp.]MBQ1897948.1 nicotinate phosphoribosyltransferase [Ruminococcus sp.]MBQ4239078.1 nicotinate phosphoribosyltransferase [Ruminococcus sp.]MBQ6412156.1 nicotinate phosphoribosyltransferase [Ruminococcus sp.]